MPIIALLQTWQAGMFASLLGRGRRADLLVFAGVLLICAALGGCRGRKLLCLLGACNAAP